MKELKAEIEIPSQGYGKDINNVFPEPKKKSDSKGGKDGKAAKKPDPYLNRTIAEQTRQAIMQFAVLVQRKTTFLLDSIRIR